jgi:hypothetical protein
MPASAGCSKVAATTLLLFFGLIWTGLTLGFDVYWTTAVYRQIAAISYPTVDGVVTASKVVVVPSRRRSTSAPKITYSFQVGNKKYESDRFRYGQGSTADGNARRIVDQFPVGRRVTVHYSPNDPSDAVLHTGIDGTDLFIAMFMTPFNAVMLVIWLGSAIAIRNSRRPPVAGGVQFWDDGFQLRVCLPRFPPWVLGAAILAGGSFLLTFVVGFFGGGFNPSLELMVVVLSLLWLAAFLAYLTAKLRVISGRADLLIDDLNGDVTLPQTYGRKEPQTLTADQLRSVVVDDVATRSSKGTTSHNYVATLTWRDREDAEHREKLGVWTDSARAENFAAWLRERLKLK